jgi:MYXO-CTERM domain-containing protein
VFYAQLADGDASWDAEIGDIDAAGLTDALANALSFAGDAAALAGRYPYLTRLTSSLSPLEMTVDPQFVANADMPEVSNVHTATLRLECDGRLRENTDRTYILSNGTRVVLPPVRAMDGQSDAEYLASIDAGAAALRVEATSASGLPTLVQDNLADIRSALDVHNAGLGCGCDTSSTGGAPALLLAAGAFARRRRRG